jgi:ubiquinone/menaquinone biosynthesis C-methylase UbiE
MISNFRFAQKIYDATWGRFVFSGAYDSFLKNAEKAGLSEQRRKIVSLATGKTLEIATGTGLNLPHYTDAVTELILTEPYPHMVKVLRNKVAKLNRRVTIVESTVETLPFPDASFDTVVATMILCSAADPEIALNEITRVLRPGGQYLFLEHVRNPNTRIARRQDLLQPGWYLFGNGCHCNRDTVSTIKRSSLELELLERGEIPRAWKIVEAMVTGSARRRLCDSEVRAQPAAENCSDSNVSRCCGELVAFDE